MMLALKMKSQKKRFVCTVLSPDETVSLLVKERTMLLQEQPVLVR